LSNKEFEERFITLHKQLFASTEFEFNDVTTHVYSPPKGLYQVDHSFIHDGKNWHLFYITGDMSKTEEYVRCMKSLDWQGAARNSVEPAIGHAIGPNLFELKFEDNLFLPSQGRFDMVTRSNGWAFRFDGKYGMLYGVRGENFTGFSLAWSKDLNNWQPGKDNPYFSAPDWTKEGSTCKDAHVLSVDGTYFIYYIVMDKEGYCCIAMLSTTDWKKFDDHGCVFKSAPMLRGTMGIESPCVVCRNGIWHMFFTYGPGMWHGVSPDPTSFVGSRKGTWQVGTGFYYMGPFHATEIIEDSDGNWWLTSDRKEETRRSNREAGRLCYRGSYEDEKTLEEGLYLSRIRWEGDQPILEKPEGK